VSAIDPTKLLLMNLVMIDDRDSGSGQNRKDEIVLNWKVCLRSYLSFNTKMVIFIELAKLIKNGKA